MFLEGSRLKSQGSGFVNCKSGPFKERLSKPVRLKGENRTNTDVGNGCEKILTI